MPDPLSLKIAVIGAGSVGATIAYAALIRGIAGHVSLYDVNGVKASAEALDLSHGLQFVAPAKVEGSADVQVCEKADVVVITAGAKQKPGQSRMDLASSNAEICKKLLPDLLRVAPDAIYLMVTNPVDVITYVGLKLTGLPRERLFGSGTVLDSSRFRYLIAQRLKLAVQSVHANIVGEHGDSEVPLWSAATVGGVPLHAWAVRGHGNLSVRDRTEIFQSVKQSAYKIIEGKGATNFAIGLATAKILEAILNDESRILPVSSLVKDWRPLGKPEEEPIDDVCLSLPTVVGRKGVEPPLAIPMNDAEAAGLRASAERIKEAARTLGF